MTDKYSMTHYRLFPNVPLKNYEGYPTVKWSDPKNWINNFEDFEKCAGTTGAALLTGEKSGIMVIDLDVNHADGVDGVKTFNEIWKDFPETLIVETPNGGMHLYFNYRKGLKSRAAYFPGIDIRTDGGVIVIPGSEKKNFNGEIGRYKAINYPNIADIPDELFEIFAKQDNLQKKEKTRTDDNDGLSGEAYLPGKRNDSLFRDGMRVFSKSNINDYNIICTFLQTLNSEKCQPPLDHDEVEKIAKSVFENIKDLSYYTPDGKVIPFSLARHVMKERPCFSRGNLTFFYNSEKGCYEYVAAHQLYKIYFDNCQNDMDRSVRKAKEFAEIILMAAQEEKKEFRRKKVC